MSQKYSKDSGQIDVAYVAHLARMHLNEDEIRLFQEQLDNILAYADQLRALNVDDIEPTSHPVPMENVMRDDDIRPGISRDAALANAPNERNGLFIVPKIIE